MNYRPIYHDNGAARGYRTRVFRDCRDGGVEWMYAVDYAQGDSRWYVFHTISEPSIAKLKSEGMFLSRLDDPGF